MLQNRSFLSRYLVFSERVYNDDAGRRLRLVFNTRTARVSALPSSLVSMLQRGDAESLPPGARSRLVDLAVLVPAKVDELSAVVGEQRESARSMSSLNYVLVPTGYCNMGCEYCGQVHVKGKTTPQHRAAVRDRVIRGIARQTTREVEVGWFGGEPMMAYAIMRDLSAAFVQAASEHGVDYHAKMTTNGALLTLRKLRVLYNECKIDRICVTIDGVGETHDRHRPLKSGGRSYDTIIATLQEAISVADELPNLRLMIRSNLDVNNIAGVGRFINAMVLAGLNHPLITFDLHEVYAWSNDVSAIRLAREQFARHEPRWLERMRREGMTTRLLPSRLNRPICPAVTRSAEVISSSGALFSCTEHPLVPKHEAADVLARVEEADPDLPRPVGQYDDWHDRIESGTQGCARCVFLPVCGGSCPKHWGENDPPCPSYKLNIQQRLDLVAAERGLRAVADSATTAGSR